jgi:hypothetical protein
MASAVAAAATQPPLFLVAVRSQIAKYDVANLGKFEIFTDFLHAKQRAKELFVAAIQSRWSGGIEQHCRIAEEMKPQKPRSRRDLPVIPCRVTVDNAERIADLSAVWETSDDCRPDTYSGPVSVVVMRMQPTAGVGGSGALPYQHGPTPVYRLPLGRKRSRTRTATDVPSAEQLTRKPDRNSFLLNERYSRTTSINTTHRNVVTGEQQVSAVGDGRENVEHQCSKSGSRHIEGVVCIDQRRPVRYDDTSQHNAREAGRPFVCIDG